MERRNLVISLAAAYMGEGLNQTSAERKARRQLRKHGSFAEVAPLLYAPNGLPANRRVRRDVEIVVAA